MKASLLICACAIGCALAGCVSVRDENSLVLPPAVVSVTSAPLAGNVSHVPARPPKMGESDFSVYAWDWVFTSASVTAFDNSIAEAKRKGGLTKVYYADYTQQSYFGFVSFFTVRVYGE